MAMTSAAGNASPLSNVFAANAMQQIGAGEFRFLGFHLYDASYWRNDTGAQALQIVYRKNIPGEALNKQMISEWRRLRSGDAEQLSEWAQLTASIWPDVTPGSSLTALVAPGSHTVFFNGDGREIGRVDDPEFGPAFLDIWLDPRTRAQRLRTALIGGRG